MKVTVKADCSSNELIEAKCMGKLAIQFDIRSIFVVVIRLSLSLSSKVAVDIHFGSAAAWPAAVVESFGCCRCEKYIEQQ